jgi:hypothetical protein
MTNTESASQGSPESVGPTSSNIDSQGADSEIRKPYSELIALSRVSAAVSGLRDLEAIFEVALDTVLQVMNGSIGWIQLVDEPSNSLTLKVLRGLP